MSRTKRVHKHLQGILTDVHPRMFHETAPEGTPTPYGVWQISSADEREPHRDDLTIRIELWDQNTDPDHIEELADDIAEALNRDKHRDTHMLVSVYRGTPYRQTIPDPDSELRRRELTFVARVYHHHEEEE